MANHFCVHLIGVDDSFSLDKFKTSCKLEIIDYAEDRVIFELIGIDVSIANALRRIMIAEVPTVAIETVHLYQNTGVIQDEVLAHRLGLIPFVIDPSTIDWRKGKPHKSIRRRRMSVLLFGNPRE